jgi:hypothetical protein
MMTVILVLYILCVVLSFIIGVNTASDGGTVSSKRGARIMLLSWTGPLILVSLILMGLWGAFKEVWRAAFPKPLKEKDHDLEEAEKEVTKLLGR